VAEQQAQWLGTVLLHPRISEWTVAGLAIVAAAAVLCLLFFGSYTSKAAISGYLVPRQGLIRVSAPQSGVVTSLYVGEGEQVAKGTPLLAISTEIQSLTIGATREEMIAKLRERRDSTILEKSVQEQLFDEEARSVTQRLGAMRGESNHIAQEVELQRERLHVSEMTANRMRTLRSRGLATEPAAEEAEQERREQASKLLELQRLQSALQRNLSELESQLQQLPLKRRKQLGEIERSVSGLEQELVQLESQREIVLVAPRDGTVTAIQVSPGGNVGPDRPLLSIVPSGAVLQAELFGPSRAIGFIHAGQPVLFPYQKFGFYKGVVTSVSRAAINSSELPQQVASLSNSTGVGEPVYRIVVELAEQTVMAYGAPVPLQPGMQVEAHVSIEKRRLFEWVLDPLFAVTGAWG
jgi:membrane fusion protein